MVEQINQKISEGALFSGINPSDLNSFSPAAQKGANNSFTCVGLIEWASEQAGHQGGEGFIPNNIESIIVNGKTIPFMSPQLLYYSMQFSNRTENAHSWFRAFFDPVDFMITDPIGRKIGYNQTSGEINQIPGAFFSGNGKLKHVLIPNPLPGRYSIELTGLGVDMMAAIQSNDKPISLEKYIANNDTILLQTSTHVKTGVAGDLNYDSLVDNNDLVVLDSHLDSFATIGSYCDLNPDGIINMEDRNILSQLISAVEDYDEDGISTSIDNCQAVSNSSQEDQDNDNYGDVCDNCPVKYNPTQIDSDGDGIGDACEVLIVPTLFLLLLQEPDISANITSHEYSDTMVGNVSVSQTFTITNNGKVDQIITWVSLDGADSSQFVIQSNTCVGQTLIPDANCTIDVTFQPSSDGVKNTSLVVESNDFEIPVVLSGVATPLILAPIANFTASPVTGSTPLTVSFTDISQNSPTAYIWDFGDNTTGTSQNPIHIYEQIGTYTVSLSVTNVSDSDSMIQADYVIVECGNSKVSGDEIFYDTIQEGYAAVVDGGEVKSRAVLIAEDLVFDQNVSVKFSGGWNCGFDTIVSDTILKGSLTISRGTVVVENLIIQ